MRAVPEKLQRCQHTCAPRLPVDPSSVDAHREGGQPKPTAAMLDSDGSLLRSLIRPFAGLVSYQRIVSKAVLHEVKEASSSSSVVSH